MPKVTLVINEEGESGFTCEELHKYDDEWVGYTNENIQEVEMSKLWHEYNRYYPELWMDKGIDYALWESFHIPHTDDNPVNSNEDLDKIDYVVCGVVFEASDISGEWIVMLKTGKYRLLKSWQEFNDYRDHDDAYKIIENANLRISRGQLEEGLHNAYLRYHKDDKDALIKEVSDRLSKSERDANAQAIEALKNVLTIVNQDNILCGILKSAQNSTE